MLDKRCIHKYRERQKFYLYVKYPRSGIFYCKLSNGKCFSTHEKDVSKAYDYVIQFLKKHKIEKIQKIKIIEIIRNYYQKDSEFLIYDSNHGYTIPETARKTAYNRMHKIADMLSDISSFNEITKKRLITLQEQLLNDGYTGKTVNNIFSLLHKIFIQLEDKELIAADPMQGLKPCSFQKAKRLCFPMEKLKGKFKIIDSRYKALAYVGMCTGARRNEIISLKKEDVIFKNEKYFLHIPGTKTENADRTIPINLKTVFALEYLMNDKPLDRNEFIPCVEWTANYIGHKEWKNDGIVYHSFRKIYKTILTQCNINSDIIEFFIGHATPNFLSNDVNRSYLVLERADMTDICEKIRKCFDYFG